MLEFDGPSLKTSGESHLVLVISQLVRYESGLDFRSSKATQASIATKTWQENLQVFSLHYFKHSII
jgi:hypothetical protein